MNINKPADLLAFWQEIHGQLDDKWHQKFLKDKLIKEILNHPTDNIKVAVRRNGKLLEILDDLRNQVDKKEAFLDKYDKYRSSNSTDINDLIIVYFISNKYIFFITFIMVSY